MLIQEININDILIEESRFNLKDFLFGETPDETRLRESFERVGILNPVILYKDKKALFHLIDGKKRIHFARQKQLRTIGATVLTESIPFTEVVNLILDIRRDEINESTINKIQFICFALSLNIEESWILKQLCIPLGFKPHGEFLKECERINNLPRELRFFCHEKRFSLKQILNLTYYPEELLLQLIEWKSLLHLTASILDEIASNLRDYLKFYNKSIKDFVSEPEVEKIIHSSLNPRDRTERLRRLIYSRRYPTLFEVNRNIEKKIKSLNLPDEIDIEWDRSLENKNIDVLIHLKEPAKWAEVLKRLNSPEMKKTIEEILKEL